MMKSSFRILLLALLPAGAFFAAGAESPPAAAVGVRDEDRCWGSIVDNRLWHRNFFTGGGLMVGDVNMHHHCYRALIRFELDTLLPAGSVERAELSFRLRGVYGVARPVRTVIVEAIPDDCLELLPAMLPMQKVIPVGEITVDSGDAGQEQRLDVTELVNQALNQVYFGVAFRFRDLAEPEGNPDSATNGVILDQDGLRLLVWRGES